MNPRRPVSASRGFTFVEVLVVSVILFIATLAIIGGLYFTNRAQKYARERTQAIREAARMLEEARRLNLSSVTQIIDQEVILDDNRTATTADDLRGLASLRLRRASDGTELTSGAGEDYIEVQATVEWHTGGSDFTNAAQRHRVTLITHFAP